MKALKIDHITLHIEDTIKNRYTLEQLQRLKLVRMAKYVKPLDSECPIWKKIVATVAMIPQSHSFIVIQTQSVLISIDYYDSAYGSIQIRVCQNLNGILDCTQGQRRRQSKIPESITGGGWIKPLPHLLVQDLCIAVVKAKPQKNFSQWNNNCHTFSETLWKILQSKQQKASLAA